MFLTRHNKPKLETYYAMYGPSAHKQAFFKKPIAKNKSMIIPPSKSSWSVSHMLRIFTSPRMKKWIPPFVVEEDESLSYWVIRVGRSWPKPEVYGSILLPCKDTGQMERYVMAFMHKKDAISASQSYMFKNHRIFFDHVSLEYLERATLNSIGVAVFDTDVTYLEPSLIIPKIDADDHGDRSQITHNLNTCLQMPFQK